MRVSLFVGWLLLAASSALADDVAVLRELDARVIVGDDAAAAAREAVRRDVRARLNDANRRSSAEWRAVQSRADWEALRDAKLARLRSALSQDPLPTEPQDVRVTRSITGDGFVIDNVLFTSRPGVVVAANLYRPPTPPAAKMPGFVICHSHHAPKTQSELQTMGMTWARQGCVVLVMDQLGHGERRTHAFGAAGRYAGDYRPERQDYYFRYNTGLQLAVVGESLMGWMVGDLLCGATLVARQPGVDAAQLVLLGAVAGGGDPAGVAGALDARFAVVAPFNYGGYEPEDVFPLPDDAEETFDYAGSGSWESTRNLRRSAVDGFLPWMVVGSIAPRSVVYAHEFRWDEPRDPVWKRLNAIFEHHDARDNLSSVVGRGTVKGRPPEASHCTNIGAVHRAQLYPILERLLGLPVPEAEFDARRESEELRCRDGDEPFALHEALQSLANKRLAAARQKRAGLDTQKSRAALRDELAPLLGNVEPMDLLLDDVRRREFMDGLTAEYVRAAIVETDGPIPLPLIVVRRRDASGARPTSVVVAMAQQGKDALLRQRAELLAACVDRGAAVVLVDLRGTGETMPSGEGRGRQSGSTGRSSSLQMLGETVVGARVRDLRSVLRYLRSRDDFQGLPIGLYGDGLVPPNAPDRSLAAPLDAADLPTQCEPGPALVALLTALWEDDVRHVVTLGGLARFSSLLDGPYCYVPHEAIVPGMLTVADVADLADLLDSPTGRIRRYDERDALNRAVPADVPAPPPEILAEFLTAAEDAR